MIRSETKGFQRLFNAYRKQPDTIRKLTIVETGMTLRRMAEFTKITWAPHKKSGVLEYGQYRDIQERGPKIIGRQFTNVEHAPFMEFGTKPHTIRPRKASVLRFFVGGNLVFTKGPVKHPGTKAVPAYRPAMIRHGRGHARRLAGRIKAKFR